MAASDSLTAAKAALTTLLQVPSIDARMVLGYEPAAGDVPSPAAVTIATVGVTAEMWTFSIRVYADPKIGAQRAAALHDTLIQEVELALVKSSLWSAPEWQVGYDDQLGWLLAIGETQIIRGDGTF